LEPNGGKITRDKLEHNGVENFEQTLLLPTKLHVPGSFLHWRCLIRMKYLAEVMQILFDGFQTNSDFDLT
jgi:hypothetical protein